MVKGLIQARLEEYEANTLEKEEQALKEILQEIVLYGLSTTDFFEKASFCGGTALRILYNLDRFSEDLAFSLQKEDLSFNWEKYCDVIINTCEKFDIIPNVVDRSKTNKAVKKMFVKDNSIGKLIKLKFNHFPDKKIHIKLEIDANPPMGANFIDKPINFPVSFGVSCYDLPSSFAGKLNAILCREYVKGRDWFDFCWYVRKKVQVNYNFLKNGLAQLKLFSGKELNVDKKWLCETLKEKIISIDWDAAKLDVITFLPQLHKRSVESTWSKEFF